MREINRNNFVKKELYIYVKGKKIQGRGRGEYKDKKVR
jgi:hypothetical protein